jgi:hypothetical protein
VKGKLIKTDVNYLLEDEKGVVVASTSLNKENISLSLKNCQTIERDNPTEEYILEVNGDGWDDHSYKGKRKQTEWDVEVEMKKVKDKTKIIGLVKGVKGSGDKITTYKSVPKLDSEGCLILKKI